MKKVQFGKKQQNGILWLLVLAAACIYLSLCFNNNIWTDEAFTIDLVKSNIAGIIAGTASDVHPPLYYLFVKGFLCVFGNHMLVMKLCSVLPTVGLMVLGATWVNKRFGFKTALLFELLLLALPRMLEYSVQLRMYALAMLFILGCAVCAYEICLEPKWFHYALLSLLAAGAAYSHYFAFVSALWIYGFLFLALIFSKKRKRLLGWLLAAIASFLIYLPWLYVMRLQVKGVQKSYWIEAITGKTIAGYFPWLFDMGIPYTIPYTTLIWMTIVVMALLGSVFWIACIKKESQKPWFAILLFLTLFLTAVTGIVISDLMKPIFIARYLMPCMPLLALCIAIIFARAGNLIVIASALFFFAATGVNYQISYYQEYQSTYTDATMQFIKEHVGQNDVVSYNYKGYDFIYSYYYGDKPWVYVEDIDWSADTHDTIWFLNTLYWPLPDTNILSQNGWTETYMGNYGIEQNDFKIYKITKNKK